MGMREGAFRGTTPAIFLNEAYRFFLGLRDECRKEVYPGYITPESEKNYTFNARDKFGVWRGITDAIYQNRFTFQAAPLGSPIPEELWTTDTPQWVKSSFTEQEILNEEIIPHELTISHGAPYRSMSMQWEKQRYRLIQKMRYCLIPLKILTTRGYDLSRWYEWYGNTGCIDKPSFSWESYPRIKVTVPDFWTKRALSTRSAYLPNLQTTTPGPRSTAAAGSLKRSLPQLPVPQVHRGQEVPHCVFTVLLT